MLPRVTAVLLLNAGLPLLQHLFPPVPLIQQVRNTPTAIVAVLLWCEGIAFLALSRAAPDYRVFRTLGVFSIVVGAVQFLTYFGGSVPSLSLRAIATLLVVETAGEAMRVPRRRWTRFFWPIYLPALVAAWFPSMASYCDWQILIAAVPLGILIVQGFRHGNSRDRMVAAAFSIYFFVRLTLPSGFEKLTGISNFVTIGGWQWPVHDECR